MNKKELEDYRYCFADNKQLNYYLSWLGYTPEEIKMGVEYYNLNHVIKIDAVQLPLAVGLIMRIIDQLNYGRKEFKENRK